MCNLMRMQKGVDLLAAAKQLLKLTYDRKPKINVKITMFGSLQQKDSCDLEIHFLNLLFTIYFQMSVHFL